MSPRWIRLWTPLRRRRAWREHGLAKVEVEGAERLQQAVEDGLGVLITPNHPTHADPFVLTEISTCLELPFYYMTAWQVFARTHVLGRRILRHHGCFSINREGHDLRAYRQAVQILEGNRPLVIFPEGEVFHLNDRVAPFRCGAATAALRAARRSGRPVACIPCGLKYRYVDDPIPELERVLSRIEHRLGYESFAGVGLGRRIYKLSAEVLDRKELEYLGERRDGSVRERTDALSTALLTRLERSYRVTTPRASVPERVKEVRRLAISRRDAHPLLAERVQRDLDDLFFVMQLFSYPTDYLANQPGLERLAETVDKLEEDVLQVPTAGLRGTRRVSVVFGEPVLAEPGAGPIAAELTEQLRRRVQHLLDDENGATSVAPPPAFTTVANQTAAFNPTAA